MGPKHDPNDNEAIRFVAYNPKNKTCTAADRSFIKRLAGKQGSETKKNRLRQEKASRTTPLSRTHVNQSESGVSTASEAEDHHASQLPLPTNWLNTPTDTRDSGGQDLRLPQPTNNNFWAEIGNPYWQGMSSQPTAPTLKSWNDADTTPSISFGHSNYLTPDHSETCSNGQQDYFSLQTEFTCPDVYDHGRQSSHADQPERYVPRAFGSFDSGFQDGDAFGYDFPRLNDQRDTPASFHGLEDARSIANARDPVQPQGESSRTSTSLLASKDSFAALYPADSDSFESVTLSGSGRQSVHGSSIGRIGSKNPPTRPSSRTKRRPSSQCITRAIKQGLWPNIDPVLARWVQYKERQGQLGHGSASACLNVLNGCEEARSLWSLNLSRVIPKLILCYDTPTGIYAQAKRRLRSMTFGQRMDVEGTLIKLGIAEYSAISLAVEVTSLQQDVATRKGLGIWSQAEAIVDHRLAGLAPGTRSMLDHLWPGEEELKSLRGV